MDLDAILGELCELETQLSTQQSEINDSLHRANAAPAPSGGVKYAVVNKDGGVKRKATPPKPETKPRGRTPSVQSDNSSNRSDSLDRSSNSNEGVNPFDAIQSQFQSALSELSGLVGGSMDPIYDPTGLYNGGGGLNNGSNSQSSETLICDSNSSTLTHNQSKSSATKQKDTFAADRQNANTDAAGAPAPQPQGEGILPRPPQIPLPPNFANGYNRTSSGSEGNSSDSGFHQMSSGQSTYSDDSLPPPPAGLKLSPSPEPPPPGPPGGHLQMDCDFDGEYPAGDAGLYGGSIGDVDSAFSDSMSLPSSGSHISVTTTSSGSSMGSGGITNSPTPVSFRGALDSRCSIRRCGSDL